jgi:class 3 adenylate cyclase
MAERIAPAHERLDLIASAVDEAGWLGYLLDSSWRLVWVSSELKSLLGEFDDARLGIGEHTLAVMAMPAWDVLAPGTARDWILAQVPLILADSKERPEELLVRLKAALEKPRLREHAAAIAERVSTAEPASWPVWTAVIEFERTRAEEWGLGYSNRYFGARMRDIDGSLIGTIHLFVPDLPGRLVFSLTRGEREMFERMALDEPRRQEAAIIFADLEGSSQLSRHLPSATYFRLVQGLTTEFDAAVARAGGIVGRHAGDGGSAFFLARDLGSPAAAVAAALEVALGMHGLAGRLAADVGVADLALNVGVHWGGTLYMGQVTGGRFEVTALGDEVNECARVQESARGGTLLATKDLLERLNESDARRLGIDPAAAAYTTLRELGVSEKAARDAGDLAVTALNPFEVRT